MTVVGVIVVGWPYQREPPAPGGPLTLLWTVGRCRACLKSCISGRHDVSSRLTLMHGAFFLQAQSNVGLKGLIIYNKEHGVLKQSSQFNFL